MPAQRRLVVGGSMTGSDITRIASAARAAIIAARTKHLEDAVLELRRTKSAKAESPRAGPSAIEVSSSAIAGVGADFEEQRRYSRAGSTDGLLWPPRGLMTSASISSALTFDADDAPGVRVKSSLPTLHV